MRTNGERVVAATQRESDGARPSRFAFTLLEVLITAVLLATLLAGIWSLYQTFAALYDTGFVQTERALLVRSINQQISEDLLATVAPAPNPPSPGRPDDASQFMMRQDSTTPSCALRVGLVGTYNTLRMDVLKTDPPTDEFLPESQLTMMPPESLVERVGDLVTVLYSFVPPAMSEMESSHEPRGLTRREIRINQSSAEDVRLAERMSESATYQFASSGGVAPETASAVTTPGSTRFGEASPPRTVVNVMPEVVALEFRYFDGQEWTDAWDSRSRHALPRAVEVSFEVQLESDSRGKAARRAATPVEVASGAPTSLPAATTASTDGVGPRRHSFRFVVYLPQSSGLETTRQAQPDSESGEAVPQPLDAESAGSSPSSRTQEVDP